MTKGFFILTLLFAITLSCPGSDQRCAACNGNKCAVCFDSFANADGVCQAVSKRIDWCLEYVNETTCKFCNHGYFVGSNGTC